MTYWVLAAVVLVALGLLGAAMRPVPVPDAFQQRDPPNGAVRNSGHITKADLETRRSARRARGLLNRLMHNAVTQIEDPKTG